MVALVDFVQGRKNLRECSLVALVQTLGAIVGVVIAHVMFGMNVLAISQKQRSEPRLYFSELIATFGLIFVIVGTASQSRKVVALSVGGYIMAAYWFTSSTSFANPAITVARSFTDTFSGIAPSGVVGFITAQILGALAAILVAGWLYRPTTGVTP